VAKVTDLPVMKNKPALFDWSKPSLVRRLWIAAFFILPISIGFSSLALNRAYEQSLDSAEYQALTAQIYALLAIAEPSHLGLDMPNVMANPRFETPDSGLYAHIISKNKNIIWQSNSLASASIKIPSSHIDDSGKLNESWFDFDSKNYRVVNLNTFWDINDQEKSFIFEVIHEQTEKQQEVAQYQRALLYWLSGMALIFFTMQVTIIYWGLRPLSFLAREIKTIEKGESSELKGHYPIELLHVTQSVNQLIESESRQRERYKHSLSDLAHSLKTPLSVIRTQLKDDDESQVVEEQVTRMSDIVNHQLKRANSEVKTLYTASIPLHPIAQRITQALNKIHRDKNIQLTLNIPNTIRVGMNEGDCMEVLGNIIENGFKYAKSQLIISAEKNQTDICIYIEDDGEGIDSNQAHNILKRGARADTSISGQGIGLSVSVDILSSYKGALSANKSNRLNGAKFKISVPI